MAPRVTACRSTPPSSTFSSTAASRGATVFKGIAGFGADHHMHSSSSVEISDHLPLVIQFVESREKVEPLPGKLEELAGSGLVEIQETTVAKPAQSSKAAPAPPPEHLKISGTAKLMRIYIGESDRWRDKPLHLALVEAMRANDIAGVTVYRGILGYGAHRRINKDKPLRLSPRTPLSCSRSSSYKAQKDRELSAPRRADGSGGPRRPVRC